MKRVLIALVLCIPGIALAAGQPLQNLQNQVNQLNTQVQNIQLIPGPQGPAGPMGPVGPEGPQGPAGATSGISAIHGTVGDVGAIVRGAGFSVEHNSTGYYTITFSTPFQHAPDCVATESFPGADWQTKCVALNTNDTSTLYVVCTEVVLFSPNQNTWPLEGSNVPYFIINGSAQYQTTNTGLTQTRLNDMAFTFICLD